MTITLTSNADGSGTLGGIGISVPAAVASTHAVQAQQTIGRNVVVNGDCSISQVNGTTLITPALVSYPIDNAWFYTTQASKLQSQQVSTKLNSLGATTALTWSVLASATIATGDSCVIQFPIEGYNFARFQYGTANAKAGSLQFKAVASVAGTYSGTVSNYGSSRSYPFTFTLAANTDTQVTIANIPGDTTGTWVGATNAGAAYIKFNLGSGATNLSATSGSWVGTNVNGVQGTTGLIAQANGSTLSITDVQFEVGSFCTTFERKLYDQVLRECQRYYEQSFFYGTAPGNGASATTMLTNSGMRIYGPCTAGITGYGYAFGYCGFITEKMSATPSITFYGNNTSQWFIAGTTTAVTMYAYGGIYVDSKGFDLVNANATGPGFSGHWAASSRI
jgi:hypothetical protein